MDDDAAVDEADGDPLIGKDGDGRDRGGLKAKVMGGASMLLGSAVGRDFECGADLTHPCVADATEPFDQQADGY